MSMQSDLFTLDWKDVLRALITSVLGFIGAVFLGALVAISAIFIPGFDVSTADWNFIMNVAMSGGVVAGIGYLIKRYVSDDDGNTFGVKSL